MACIITWETSQVFGPQTWNVYELLWKTQPNKLDDWSTEFLCLPCQNFVIYKLESKLLQPWVQLFANNHNKTGSKGKHILKQEHKQKNPCHMCNGNKSCKSMWSNTSAQKLHLHNEELIWMGLLECHTRETFSLRLPLPLLNPLQSMYS